MKILTNCDCNVLQYNVSTTLIPMILIITKSYRICFICYKYGVLTFTGSAMHCLLDGGLDFPILFCWIVNH